MGNTNRFFKTEHWPLTTGQPIRILHVESPIAGNEVSRAAPSPHFTSGTILPNVARPDSPDPKGGDAAATPIDAPATQTTPQDQESHGERPGKD